MSGFLPHIDAGIDETRESALESSLKSFRNFFLHFVFSEERLSSAYLLCHEAQISGVSQCWLPLC